jgi:hypothetical protein
MWIVCGVWADPRGIFCANQKNGANSPRQCSWGRVTSARKPRTEAHFEALQKRADSLQAYVDGLEEVLSNCVCQDVAAHLQQLKLREPIMKQPTPPTDESDTDGYDSDESITQELTVPLQRLKVCR